jgi:DtxR family Mn-dependent transcriptional regulator
MEENMTPLSQSLEEYLESIYIISKKKKTVRVKDVVKDMQVKSASVIGALKKLTKLGYIEHEHYGYIELTRMGEAEANKIYAKHKVLFKFLAQVLGVTEETAERDACSLEHHISNETLKKLIEWIHHMETNPHARIRDFYNGQSENSPGKTESAVHEGANNA